MCSSLSALISENMGVSLKIAWISETKILKIKVPDAHTYRYPVPLLSRLIMAMQPPYSNVYI
jgi:hypothetical protein